MTFVLDTGALPSRGRLSDALDAALAALCGHDNEVLMSDPVDISALAQAARFRVSVMPA